MSHLSSQKLIMTTAKKTKTKPKIAGKKGHSRSPQRDSVLLGPLPPGQPQAYNRLKLPVGSTMTLDGFAFLGKGVTFSRLRVPACPTGSGCQHVPKRLILVHSLRGALVASHTFSRFLQPVS